MKALGVVFAVVLAGCGTIEQSSMPTVAVPDIVISGTRAQYTFEETQAYGEFGPLIWDLVTTLSGTDDIPHGPAYEWVTWGSQWAGYQAGTGPIEVYGVTDLGAVDVEAVAAVVPVGTTIILRQVEWTLDELEEYLDSLWEGAPENGVCSVSFGLTPNRVRVVARNGLNLADVPPEALAIEFVPACLGTVPAG